MLQACSRFGIASRSLAGFASALVLASLALGADAFGAATAPVTKTAAVPAAPPAAAKPAAPAVAVPPSIAARPQGYADLAERLLPMVVNISTAQICL